MTMRERAQEQYSYPTSVYLELSSINHFFHNSCLSWPYIGKY